MPRYVISGSGYDGFFLSPLDDRPSRFPRKSIELTEAEYAEWQRIDRAHGEWQDRISRASEDEASEIPATSVSDALDDFYRSVTAPDGSLVRGVVLDLTSIHREPGPGSMVTDASGDLWYSDDHWPACWTRHGGGDPETWTKVAGNYGPVRVVVLNGWRR